MRSVAATLADLLPPAAAEQVRKATGGTLLSTMDEEMQPVVPPQAPRIAKALPVDTAVQVMRLADRLEFPAIDVVIEVANVITKQSGASAGPRQSAVGLAAGSFPAKPLETPAEQAPAQPPCASRPCRPRAPRRQA
jgi:hypothetical protein